MNDVVPLSPVLRSRAFSLARGSVTGVFWLVLALCAGRTQTNFYWDLNGSSNGAGVTPSGIWDTTSLNWNTTANGTTANEVFVSGGNALFSAGTNASGAYTITVSGTQNVSGITIQDGTPTFTGGTINFNDATPTLTVNNNRTLNWGSTAITSLTNTVTKGGGGTLNFNQNFTFGGTLNLSGGTLRLTDSQLTLGTLNVTANTTIDFAGSASTLNLSNLTIAAGVTLTITNWSNATDYFYTSNWSGAALDVSGSTPMNRVVFNGFTGANTHWSSFDHQITPVPEPATYGALFFSGLAGFGLIRRWRTARRSR